MLSRSHYSTRISLCKPLKCSAYEQEAISMRYGTLSSLIVCCFALLTTAQGYECVECHKEVTPNIVKDWQNSMHSENDIDCSTCHGSRHTTAKDVRQAEIPTPETCNECHEDQVEQFPTANMLLPGQQ